MVISRSELPKEYWGNIVSFNISSAWERGPGRFGLFDNIIELLLNITAFIPIGYLLTKLVKKVSLTLGISFLLILLVETLQLLLRRGFFELSDIILNFTGAVIGCALCRRKRSIKALSNTDIALLGLIKQSLFGIQAIIPEDINWNCVLVEAQNQAITGIVSSASQCGELWRDNKLQVMSNHIQARFAERDIVSSLEKESIPVAVLKGNAAAVYYPEPYLRTMGDIDLIVPQEFFDKAEKVFESKGYKCVEKYDGRHVTYKKDGYLFELHHHFSHDDVSVESCITEGMKHLVIGQIKNYKFPMLPTLANGIVLLDHMRQHLQTGLGLRQVLDWMMYVDKELDDSFWNSQFEDACNHVGMKTLAITATRMCQLYLGLTERITWCMSADASLCRSLLDNLLSSGNFGKKHGTGMKSETILTAIKGEGMIAHLQRAGEWNWSAYKKNPKLKPFCWLYQLCKYMRQVFQSREAVVTMKDIVHSKRRSDLMDELNVYRR